MPRGHLGREIGLARLSRAQSSPDRREREDSCRHPSQLSLKIAPSRQCHRLLACRRSTGEPRLSGGSYSAADLLLNVTPLKRVSEVVGRRTAPPRLAVLACRCQVPAAGASSTLVSIQIGRWAHHGLAERCVSPPFSDSLDRRTVAWPVLPQSGRQAEPVTPLDLPTQSATHTTIPAVVAR